MNLVEFEIDLGNGLITKGEYEGNSDSKKVVIFSHGFGVTRDSHGMFNELGDLFKDEYLVARFDYTKIIPEENATYAYPFSTQQKMLKRVINYISSKFGATEVNIIAHSQGCLIVGLLPEDVIKSLNKVILIASPTTSMYQRLLNRFGKRAGSIMNESGISKLKRSDGSWTYLDADYWPDTKTIVPLDLFKSLSSKTKTYFIKAMHDDVVIEDNYDELKDIFSGNYFELPGDHNFSGDARQGWLDKVAELVRV